MAEWLCFPLLWWHQIRVLEFQSKDGKQIKRFIIWLIDWFHWLIHKFVELLDGDFRSRRSIHKGVTFRTKTCGAPFALEFFLEHLSVVLACSEEPKRRGSVRAFQKVEFLPLPTSQATIPTIFMKGKLSKWPKSMSPTSTLCWISG